MRATKTTNNTNDRNEASGFGLCAVRDRFFGFDRGGPSPSHDLASVISAEVSGEGDLFLARNQNGLLWSILNVVILGGAR